MVSKGRLDDRSIKRRGPTRQPKRRILIVCEGQETERGYFEKFQHAVRNPRVHVKVAKETGVPMTVVTEAIRLKEEADEAARLQRDENLRWDEVWCVCDVDEHPKLKAAYNSQRRSLLEWRSPTLRLSCGHCYISRIRMHILNATSSVQRCKYTCRATTRHLIFL